MKFKSHLFTARCINYATISRKAEGDVVGGCCNSDVSFCESAREILPQSSQRTQRVPKAPETELTIKWLMTQR